jgi:tryptophanyl-tRNA synthetase
VEKEKIDPWGSSLVRDYSRLQSEFGIEPITNLASRLKNPSLHIRRGIDFGHRGLGKIIDAIEKNERYAVMSGIKPTGIFHLGTKMTADDMIYFQSLSRKATVFYAIADVEAYCDNGISFNESRKIAIQNVADILALGLDPERLYVYLQSEEMRVMKLSTIFSRGVTNNMLKAIYGERQIGLYLSALIQVGDILMPQLEDFGGPKPTIVPVGVDQDPHIRLARDLAEKFRDQFGFIQPSAIYHRLMLSLSGEIKMSKRSSSTLLTLADSKEDAEDKVMDAFTGGRATVDEQRRLGGEAEKCPVFDLYNFHFASSDEHTREVYRECYGGVRMCGECKEEASKLVKEFLEEHQLKKQSYLSRAEELIRKGSKEVSSALK